METLSFVSPLDLRLTLSLHTVSAPAGAGDAHLTPGILVAHYGQRGYLL